MLQYCEVCDDQYSVDPEDDTSDGLCPRCQASDHRSDSLDYQHLTNDEEYSPWDDDYDDEDSYYEVPEGDDDDGA